MSTPIIRMYVDENGHQSLDGDLCNPSKRFLCLTGIIMPIKEHDDSLTPRINDLKTHYFHDPSVILHRREIISAEGAFSCLSEPSVRARFNQEILDIMQVVNYRIISIVIDKYALVQKYGRLRAQDPYALSLEFLMQRYQYWMQSFALKKHIHCPFGDILAESRGGGEDRLTKLTYQEIYAGRGFNRLQDASKYYTSSQIKLKPKKANIAGLQFVDLISHPARRYILMQYGLGHNFKTSSFEEEIVNILVRDKFRRNNLSEIKGHGAVLFP